MCKTYRPCWAAYSVGWESTIFAWSANRLDLVPVERSRSSNAADVALTRLVRSK